MYNEIVIIIKESYEKKFIIALLVIMLLVLSGYVTYDKLIKKDDSKQNLSTGKIYIKENGVVSLKTVPNDIVGKYVNSDSSDSYFVLNNDGTAEISEPSGGGKINFISSNELEFQLTYLQHDYYGSQMSKLVVIEFYDKSDKHLPSLVAIGKKISNEDNYDFYYVENTPSSVMMETKFKKEA